MIYGADEPFSLPSIGKERASSNEIVQSHAMGTLMLLPPARSLFVLSFEEELPHCNCTYPETFYPFFFCFPAKSQS